MAARTQFALLQSRTQVLLHVGALESIRRKRRRIDPRFSVGHHFGQQQTHDRVIRKASRLERGADEQSRQPVDRTDDRFAVHRKGEQADLFAFPLAVAKQGREAGEVIPQRGEQAGRRCEAGHLVIGRRHAKLLAVGSLEAD